jgi:threonine 3-dehydrogenase
LDVSAVVTHHFDVDDYAEAFAAVSSGECGKVVLDWHA